MKYGVLLGSNLFIDTFGTLSYIDENQKLKQFFKVKEIWRQRSEGSYLALDVDVKDIDGNREIKLHNSKPVAEGDVNCDRTETGITVRRDDGSLVIKVEQLDPSALILENRPLIMKALKDLALDAIIKITGGFTIQGVNVTINDETIDVGGFSMSGNFVGGTKAGITLSQRGLSLG